MVQALSGSQKTKVNEVNINSMVSDFVDAVRLEQSSKRAAAEMDLQEKERRKASANDELHGQQQDASRKNCDRSRKIQS